MANSSKGILPGSQTTTVVATGTAATATVSGTNTGPSASSTACPESAFSTQFDTSNGVVTVYTPLLCVVEPSGGTASSAAGSSKSPPNQSVVSSAVVVTTKDAGGNLVTTTSEAIITSTPPSSASPNKSTGGGGISRGAVAGAAIGALVVGAALAFLAAWLLFRKRRKPEPRGGGAAFTDSSEKSSPNQPHPWDSFLPQSADDGTMRAAIEKLYSQIDLHVENYYRGMATSQMSGEAAGAMRMADSGLLPGSVEEVMSRTQTALPVIKHCFAYVILSRLSPGASPERSLLPTELARSPPGGSSKASGAREERAMNEAYSYWRVLTAKLMFPRQGNSSPDVRAGGTNEVMHILSTAFAPWAKAGSNSAEAQDHMNGVLKSATDTGLLVASQRSTFRYDWNASEQAQGPAIVVTPAFAKVSDERGGVLAQQQVLVRSKLERIKI